MIAINRRAHEQFIERVGAMTGSKTASNEIQQDLEMIQQLHEQYQQHLCHLRQLTATYKTVHRKMRVALREQQLREKRKVERTKTAIVYRSQKMLEVKEDRAMAQPPWSPRISQVV